MRVFNYLKSSWLDKRGINWGTALLLLIFGISFGYSNGSHYKDNWANLLQIISGFLFMWSSIVIMRKDKEAK